MRYFAKDGNPCQVRADVVVQVCGDPSPDVGQFDNARDAIAIE
jgi:hypothetical protein